MRPQSLLRGPLLPLPASGGVQVPASRDAGLQGRIRLPMQQDTFGTCFVSADCMGPVAPVPAAIAQRAFRHSTYLSAPGDFSGRPLPQVPRPVLPPSRGATPGLFVFPVSSPARLYGPRLLDAAHVRLPHPTTHIAARCEDDPARQQWQQAQAVCVCVSPAAPPGATVPDIRNIANSLILGTQQQPLPPGLGDDFLTLGAHLLGLRQDYPPFVAYCHNADWTQPP
eukprot:XP_001695263.1 predicted protein [Chlamydomonas reinhardtii]